MLEYSDFDLLYDYDQWFHLHKTMSQFSQNKLYPGGVPSSFFGGLSSHQGAFEVPFLIKCGLTKEAFIETGVIIASVVDISRIAVYFSGFSRMNLRENSIRLLVATIGAFAGAFAGKNHGER